MSRYEIESTNNNLEIMVGWDAPLNTYFCYVIDLNLQAKLKESKEEEVIDPVLLWVGTTYDEILTVGDLCDKIPDYVTIPPEILGNLKQDANEVFEPSSVQS